MQSELTSEPNAHRFNWGSEVGKTSKFLNGGVQRRRFFLRTSSDIHFTASVKFEPDWPENVRVTSIFVTSLHTDFVLNVR